MWMKFLKSVIYQFFPALNRCPLLYAFGSIESLKQRIICHFFRLSQKGKITIFFAENTQVWLWLFFWVPLCGGWSWLLVYVLCKLCGTLICHQCNIKLRWLSISFCSIILAYTKNWLLFMCKESKTITKFFQTFEHFCHILL